MEARGGTVSAAVREHLRQLCLHEFPCGTGSWVRPPAGPGARGRGGLAGGCGGGTRGAPHPGLRARPRSPGDTRPLRGEKLVVRAMSAVRTRGGPAAGASPASAGHQLGVVVRGGERDVEAAAARRAGASGVWDGSGGLGGKLGPASARGPRCFLCKRAERLLRAGPRAEL